MVQENETLCDINRAEPAKSINRDTREELLQVGTIQFYKKANRISSNYLFNTEFIGLSGARRTVYLTTDEEARNN